MAVNVTSDGKITKEVLRDGTGASPAPGYTVTLHYVATLQADGTEFDSSRSGGSPRSFLLKPDATDFYSLAASAMRVGELSRFAVSPEYSPSNAASVFEVELLTITDTAIAEANRLSDAGGASFRGGNYPEAAGLYLRALSLIAGRDATDTALKLRRNLAVTLARAGEWRESLRFADEVLKEAPTDARALLRRAEASAALGNFEQAKEAIEFGEKGADRAAAVAFAAVKVKVEEAEGRERGTQAALCRRMVAAPE
jgi:tetratricopeptide (TPR) repeat protein